MSTFTHEVADADELVAVVASYAERGYKTEHSGNHSVLLAKRNVTPELMVIVAIIFAIVSFAFDGGLFGGDAVDLWTELRGAVAVVGVLIVTAITAVGLNLQRSDVLVTFTA